MSQALVIAAHISQQHTDRTHFVFTSFYTTETQGPAVSHLAVVGSSPVHIKTLQQNLGDLDLLGFSVARDVQGFTELSHRLLPVVVPEEGVALIQQIAHQLGEEVLEERKGKERRGYHAGGVS